MFEESWDVGMRGLRRISIQSVHARGIGGIIFEWMQIVEEDFGRTMGSYMFEKTLHVGM